MAHNAEIARVHLIKWANHSYRILRIAQVSQKVSPVTRLEFFKRVSGFSNDELGKRIDRTGIQVSRYCKSRNDPGHNVPQWQVGEALKKLTHGVIDLGNYADELTPAEAAEMMAEIARREAAAKAGEVARG